MKICTGFSDLISVKNTVGVIRAMGKIGGIWELRVVGDGLEKSSLEKLARELGVEGKVKFYGRVPNDEARKILRESDIFILNSLHEGMPHAMLEALIEGIPVIATKIPAVLEVLEDKENAILVEAGNDLELTKAIETLINDSKLREKIAKNGQILARNKFTWERHLEELKRVFNSIT